MSFFGISTGGGSGGGGTTIINTPPSHIVDNITERNELTAKSGELCYVEDATGDSTVESGFALYLRVASSWVKISDERIMQMQVLTQEDKQQLEQNNEEIQVIKQVLEDNSLIHVGSEPPVDKTMVWFDELN